jgi:thiol-disulfide isomerase/thioredoxin
VLTNGAVPPSDFLLTNTCLSSAFYAAGSQFSSGQHRPGPAKNRCRLDENPRKGQIWSGVGTELISLFLASEDTIISRLSYQECTERVLKRYWQGTKELLKRYQISTKQVQAFGSFLVNFRYKLGPAMEIPAKMHSGDLVSRGDGCRLKSEDLQVFSATRVCKNEYLAVQKKIGAQKALKCVIYPGNYKRYFRISLPCLFLVIVFQSSNFSFKALKSIRALMVLALMVSMFSLSAQTPRKDSGADGLSNLVALKPGDRIPDAVWDQSLELNYFNGKKKTIKFAELKGKLIILDFWSTGCASCIEGIPKMELIQQRFKDQVKVLMVNSKRNKDTPERINKRFEKYKADFNYTPSLPTILGDTVFTMLFEHNSLPTMAIIDPDGKFVVNSFSGSITEQNIQDVFNSGSAKKFIEKSAIKNLNRVNTVPLVDTTGLQFVSAMSGYRENYLGVYPAVQHKNGSSLFQVGNYSLNTCYQLAFPDVFQGTEFNLFVFDQHVEKGFIDLLYDFKTRKGQFWYQLYVRDSIPESLAFNYFRQALLERFKVVVERRNDPVEAYVLTLDVKSLTTKGGMRIYSVDKGNQSLILQNTPVNGVVNFLRSVLDKPVFSKITHAEKLDLKLPGSFLELSVDQKIATLRQYGIHLQVASYNGEYPYFYPVAIQHTK